MNRSERMKALHADPEFNPLAALSPDERADYDVLREKATGKDWTPPERVSL